MKIGRNDPCPCGSGKKYKQCCIHKQRAERHQQRLRRQQRESEQRAEELSHQKSPSFRFSDLPEDALDSPPSDLGEETFQREPPGREDESEPDPHAKAADARWDEFEAADYEGHIEQFMKMLDEPDATGDELAFHMLESIRHDALKRDERDRFGILVRALGERLPEVYAKNAAYLLSWLIDDALAGGRFDVAASLGKEMAAYAGRDIDMFTNVARQLAYHGQLATLVEMVRIAWPLVRESGDVLPWGVDEFLDRAIWCEALHYCEHASPPRPDDPELNKRLEFYTDSLAPEWLPEVVEILTGSGEKAEPPSDAGLEEPKESTRQRRKRVRKQRQRRMYLTSLEFLRYLFRQEGVPYAKAELARVKFFDYLIKRAEGELEPDGDFVEPKPRRKRKSKSRHQPDHAELCPDRETLDRYLAGLLGIFGEGTYEVAALMEVMPAWLRFLRRRELIDAEQYAATFDELSRLNDGLLPYFQSHRDDPALYQGARRAWQETREFAEEPPVY